MFPDPAFLGIGASVQSDGGLEKSTVWQIWSLKFTETVYVGKIWNYGDFLLLHIVNPWGGSTCHGMVYVRFRAGSRPAGVNSVGYDKKIMSTGYCWFWLSSVIRVYVKIAVIFLFLFVYACFV
jgi:hypothetical protein